MLPPQEVGFIIIVIINYQVKMFRDSGALLLFIHHLRIIN